MAVATKAQSEHGSIAALPISQVDFRGLSDSSSKIPVYGLSLKPYGYFTRAVRSYECRLSDIIVIELI